MGCPRTNPEIETGHVRKTARLLEITDCATSKLPTIFSRSGSRGLPEMAEAIV
jgi:hypothetical protein